MRLMFHKEFTRKVITRWFSLSVPAYSIVALFGVGTFFALVLQIISGLAISFSVVNDSMLLVISREELDLEELYYDDFFLVHEKTLNYVFFYVWLHIIQKLNVMSSFFIQLANLGWRTGSITFLMLHATVFFGIILCCTHLSDITLKIAANIVQTFFFKYGNVSYFLFTTNSITTDTLIRMMYLHYIFGIVMFGFMVWHLDYMHASFIKNASVFPFVILGVTWVFMILSTECLFVGVTVGSSLIYYNFFLKQINEPISFELFMWGDIGLVSEVRFLSVAPHWYFRSYMGWLLFCPHHYIGIFGLAFFLFFLHFKTESVEFFIRKIENMVDTFLKGSYISSLIVGAAGGICILYTFTYLPCGKYFTFVKGNKATTFSYLIMYIHVFVPIALFIKKNFSVLIMITKPLLVKYNKQ